MSKEPENLTKIAKNLNKKCNKNWKIPNNKTLNYRTKLPNYKENQNKPNQIPRPVLENQKTLYKEEFKNQKVNILKNNKNW